VRTFGRSDAELEVNTKDALVAAPSEVEQPIRAEVFGIERLQQHAETLAAAQPTGDERFKGRALLPRVRENGRVLLAGYRNIVEAVRQKNQIMQAEEWLLDNFHVVDGQIRDVRDHLPLSFYKLLPKIAEGRHLGGYPRVYGLAWAYVAHTDSRFDVGTLQAFVRAYQRVQPLGIGELWAVAIHLRVALLENLRRLSELIIRARHGRASADEVADRLLGLSGRRAERAEDVLDGLGNAPLASAFAVQLLQRLRDQAPSVTPALDWLNENLAAQGTSPSEVVAQAHQAEAAANITVRNIITSMRWMSSISWPGFFESVSLVDETLRTVPGFAAMDFATRDKYRAAVEELSRGSKRSELEVAGEAVRLAREARRERERTSPQPCPDEETAPSEHQSEALAVPERPEEDPGYYLVSRGRWAFERQLGYRVPVRIRIRRAWRAHAVSGYFGLIAVLTALVLSGPLFVSWSAGVGVPILILLGILAFVPASDIAVSLVHRLVALIVPPRLLCKLELDRGVPAELRTMVVVPTLLSSRADIDESIERLQVHHLANPEGHLHFALLTDWSDAANEHMPGDEDLLAALADGIAGLNERYGSPPGGGERFILLHRRRLWNEGEGRWMGWERKRGKLHELNRLLRGATDTTFIPIKGIPPTVPQGVRYVITLDADTRLPGRAAYRLVGAMAHPLNRPRLDPEIGRVVEGYAILQPRITPSLPTGPGSTTYQRIVSGPGGVDPYAAAVSDVYQDLFGEGSYTGKGIYDVDAFQTALAGRVPENALLSHDLFEGLFARAGLVTDIDLFEEFPTNYEVAVRRNHRWVRGDWQLLPWILGHKDDEPGRGQRGRIPVHGRWKMLDNLRRSLAAPAAFLLGVAAWTLPAVSPLLWTGLFLAAIALPAFMPVLDDLLPRRQGFSKRNHLRGTGHDIQVASLQVLLAIATLAHQARYMADAVVRTLGRLYVTKRQLLEWVPAAQAGYGVDLRLRSFYWHLRWSVVLASGVCVLFVMFKLGAWPVAAPLVLLWGLAPILAWRLSVPVKLAEKQRLSPLETRTLRLIARRTWRFFETFVKAEEHALPPDNFQEDPEPVVAHRTSPTNMGLYLLSTMVAHDFGWIGISDMVQRLEATLETLTTMRRLHGHFFNWYDTRDLRPLDPLYISTVDSGNLAGHLIALSQGCRQLAQRPLLGPQILDGIRDALEPVLDSLARSKFGARTETVTALQVREALNAISAGLDDPPSSIPEWGSRLEQLEARAENLLDIVRTVSAAAGQESGPDVLAWATAVRDTVRSHARDLVMLQAEDSDASAAAAITLDHRLSAVALQAEQMALAMDFRFLFDSSRKLFSIGFRVADNTLDPSCYDLLASEARLASFVAIAKGDVSPRHWFLLGRSLTPVGHGAALVSWSGSMFEYLMPLLVMEQPARSLLDLTSRLVVGRQVRYGAERGVPWGVSESAYNVRDVKLTYQYSDFGVPGLGLKRGLFEDVVVAPYATALAAMVDPKAAIDNIAHLEDAGARSAYGFYEALDFTPSRLPEDERVAVVRACMAHHQGMTIVSLGNVVHQGLTQRRFHAHPMIQASELLLQERTPRAVAVTRPRGEEVQVAVHIRDLVSPTLRRFESPHDIPPRTHLLSNGRYLVMVTAAGSGFSRWHNLAVTRWREDTTRDCWGTFIFLRDAKSGDVWSAGFQPSGTEVDKYNVVYAEDRAKIMQRDRSLSITLDIVVSPEDDAELRQLTVTNLENRDREIDFTSYAEVALAPQAADEAHPVFSNLFVETEIVPELETLLATRRARSADEPQPWLAHVAAVEGEIVGTCEYESDRARFVGRGRGVRTPVSVIEGEPLTNTAGTILDPMVSLRYRVAIPPGGTVRLVFTTLVAPSREEALDTAVKYRQPGTFERESSLAWMYAQVQLHHLRITQDEAHLFQRLANRLLYNDRTLRTTAEELATNRRGPSGLWAYGISGDLPIAVVRVEREEERDVARQLLRAHEYWRLKGITSDFVILNATGTSYAQDLQEAFEAMVRASQSALGGETDGGLGNVFVLREDLLPAEDLLLLRSAARVVVLANRGTLSEQVIRLQRLRPGPVPPRLRTPREEAEPVPPPTLDLEHFNGLGGFSQDGREYVTLLGQGQWTPAPWINVVGNPDFGFQVSESGSGYTWSVNSRENKLTPWSNDPVSDTPGEAFYVRDLDSGLIWGPTCLPIREEASPYVIRHGRGYSRFEHTSHGIALDLLQFVPPGDPIKISRLTLVNRSSRKRRLSITAYAEWVLGVTRSRSAPYVVTEIDQETGATFARNAWNGEFASRVAFADLGGRQMSWTCDRLDFLGRNASLDHPASLERGDELSGTTGATLDPCAALQTEVELQPGQRVEVLFLLGQGESPEQARTLIERYRGEDCAALLRQVQERWDTVLGTVQVRTPDASMDLLLNRWLLYQTLSCRLWSRSAFYQSGGAYGFRDQLQDVMALLVARPDIAREHILRAAARQFPEGDVQHWWHPPTGRGVRTRISDDRLWLPYAVAQYLAVTEDWGVLDETIPWLQGPILEEQEQESYFEPEVSEDRSTLFEHCARALDRSLDAGSHGLPLIGGGDWNDGMNRVGRAGRGESVWLGWFLHVNLSEFAAIADRREEEKRAAHWRTAAASLAASLDREAWDGEWYKRAFFDDGTPLGSAQNDECQIDSIAQSWAVLSGAGDPDRARQAMESVERRLVRQDDRLLLLFSPPFDQTHRDPGYIKGYLPGIRENGGQYTHAAIWSVIAFARLGEGDKSLDLFDLLNPIHHASRRASAYRYKVEPYVVAADIYSAPAHVGRGGWTWYTGAAAWLYRAGLESILGFRKRGSALAIDPCIPRAWKRFEIVYRHGDTLYRIAVENPDAVCRGVSSISLDGTPLPVEALVPLSEDGLEHRVQVVLG
jgi:cyclic beta-1,2-glucan synthetase